MADKELSIRLKAIGGDQVRKEFSNVGKEGKGAFDDIRKSSGPATQGLEAVNTSAKALNNVFRQAGILIGAYIGLSSISQGFSFILSTNREFERLNASLKTVTGSVEDAENAFAMIEDFAATTPYSVEQVANAFIRLKSLGLDPTMEALQSYGNTSAALGRDIIQFVEAVADATTGEYERLKEFGIRASRDAQNVSFTFQGTTTTIANNASAVEEYLQSIGNVQFAGALEDQMSTLNGVFSNLEDTLAGLAREVGSAGLNQAISDVVLQFGDLVASGDSVARTIGEGLASAVRTAGDALEFLVENGEVIIDVITGFAVARTAAAAFTVLQGAILLVTTAIGAMGTAAGVASVAMGTLTRVVSILGGPIGAIAAAGFAIYQFTSFLRGNSESSELAADMLAKYGSALDDAAETTQDSKARFDALVVSFADLDEQARSDALIEWSTKLSTATADANLMQGAIVNLIDESGDLEDALEDEVKGLDALVQGFIDGKTTAGQFQTELAKIAENNGDVEDFVEDVTDELQALSAVQEAVKQAQETVNALNFKPVSVGTEVEQPDAVEPALDPTAKRKIDEYIVGLEQEIEATERLTEARLTSSQALAQATLINEQNQAIQKLGIDLTAEEGSTHSEYAAQIRALIEEKNNLLAADLAAQEVNKAHQASVKAISDAYLGLGSETDKAISKADAWKQATLEGLDETRESYAAYALQVEDIHARMLADARNKDTESLESWQQAIVAGFDNIVGQGQNMASQLENLTADVFKSMEDSLVNFVTTGELNFNNFVNSVLEGFARIAIRETITKPLATGFSSLIGGLVAHGGGIIGEDRIGQRIIPISSFQGAERFHSGGIVGRETPIIAQVGEGVFTPGQMRALGASMGQPIMSPKTEIHIHNNAPKVQATAQTRQNKNGTIQIDVLIEQVESMLSQNIAKGSGLAPTMERKYGLNPAMGSYR